MSRAYQSDYRPGALDSSELDPCIAAESRLKKSAFSSKKKRTFVLIAILAAIFLVILSFLLYIVFSKNASRSRSDTLDYEDHEVPMADLKVVPPILTPQDREIPRATERSINKGGMIRTTARPIPTTTTVRTTIEAKPFLSGVDEEVTSSTTTTSTTTRSTSTATTTTPAPTTVPVTTTSSSTTSTTTSTTTTTTPSPTTTTTAPPVVLPSDGEQYVRKKEEVEESCEVHALAGLGSGVYRISPDGGEPFDAYCLMETVDDPTNAGWMVVQRRSDPLRFYDRLWTDYVRGFGRVDGTHWLGLGKMWQAASANSNEDLKWTLRIELHGDLCNDKMSCSQEPNGFWWGEWNFGLGSPDSNFRLHIKPCSKGNLTGHDEINDDFFNMNNGQPFSTMDHDHDSSENKICAQFRNAGAWWHKDCSLVALNGLYGDTAAKMRYQYWLRRQVGLTKTYYIHPRVSLMMIRPRRG